MPQNFARIIDRRVARRIRERRLHIGMTQNELARILGVAFQQAHKWMPPTNIVWDAETTLRKTPGTGALRRFSVSERRGTGQARRDRR